MGAEGERFGDRLRRYRLAADLSQRGLAQRSGLSIRMIGDLERGHTRWPYPDSLNRLADALALDGPPRAAFISAAGRHLGRIGAGSSSGGGSTGARAAGRPRQLPASVPGFAGRARQLDALSRLLEQPDGAAMICAIGGMAGVGKTALAIQWAHQVAAKFPDGQLYVNLRGFDPSAVPVTTAEAVRGFLDALGVPADQRPGTTQAQLGLYRSLLAGQRMLVMIDNARDVAHARPLLPGSPTCRVVVTSRNQLAGLAAIEAARPLLLDGLTDSESRQLLAGRLGRARLAADPDAVTRIVSACAGLPLALSIAAAAAATQPGLSISQVAPGLAARTDLGDDVRTTFSWSYRQLAPASARVFRFASLHPGPDFDSPAIAALTGLTAEQAVRELDALARVCMIQANGPRTYCLHELLRVYAAELADACDPEADRRRALASLLDYYLGAAALAMDAVLPAESHRRPVVSRPADRATEFPDAVAAMAWLRARRASLVATVGYAADDGWPERAIGLAAVLFRFLDTDAQLADGIAVSSSARRAARRLGDQVAEATCLLSLGTIYLHQGRYRQGMASFRHALALGRGTGDVTTQARAVAGLGLGNVLLGRPQTAAANLEQAIALFRQQGDLIGEARARANLGFAALRQGRYADATTAMNESLTVCGQVGDRRGQACALANLGAIELRQDHNGRAASYLLQALRGFRQVGDRIGEADTMASLGLTDLRQGRPVQAMDHLTQALTICRQAGAIPRQALALNGLGEVLLATEQLLLARKHFDAALKLAVQADDKYEQARAHDGLATAYQASGARSQARRHWREALVRYSDLGAPEADQVRSKLQAVCG